MGRALLGLFLAILFLHSNSLLAQIAYEHGEDAAAGPGERIIYKYETYWGLRDDPPKQYSMGPGGPFVTKSEAEKQLSDKIASTKKNGYWAVTHGLIKRVPYNSAASNGGSASDPGTGATVGLVRGTSIDVKTPQFVDPGGSANSDANSGDDKDLKGKSFKGKIGNIPVTFSFVGEQEMKISSGLKSLDAKWSLDATGQLSIRANNATFVGSRVGNKFRGKRRPLSNPSVTSEWEFELDAVSEAAEKGKAYNDPRDEKSQAGENVYSVQCRENTQNIEGVYLGWREWFTGGLTVLDGVGSDKHLPPIGLTLEEARQSIRSAQRYNADLAARFPNARQTDREYRIIDRDGKVVK